MARRKYIQTNNDTINSFVIQVTLIEPVQDIVSKLENGNFRDCDIKWLDEKLYSFVSFSAQTLGLKIGSSIPESNFTFLNEYAKQYYLKYFNQILAYFKTF